MYNTNEIFCRVNRVSVNFEIIERKAFIAILFIDEKRAFLFRSCDLFINMIISANITNINSDLTIHYKNNFIGYDDIISL